MVPWQRSHSHLLNNDDKRRNKQNPSKKNVDSQRFSQNEKQALTPTAYALFWIEFSPAQVSVPQELSCRWEKTHLQELPNWSTHSPPSAHQHANSSAEARGSVHQHGVEHRNTGPPPHLQEQSLLLTSGGLSTSLHFCRMRHWIIKSSGQIMLSSHRSVKTSGKCSLVQTPAGVRGRCTWASRTHFMGFLKVSLGAANNALHTAPVHIFFSRTQLSNFTVNYIFIKAYVLHN